MAQSCLQVEQLEKSFMLHHQSGVTLNVFKDISFNAYPGECVVLQGESGQGKSTLLRCMYANYISDSGAIIFHDDDTGENFDITRVSPHRILKLRREKIAYVSQFLNVIPRVPAIQVVCQPMLDVGYSQRKAQQRAEELLTRLNIPSRLWTLSPTTFSGGERQRINIAREFSLYRPLILLDEPTASLDEKNSAIVVELIRETKEQGSCVIAIFHDPANREAVADRVFYLSKGVML